MFTHVACALPQMLGDRIAQLLVALLIIVTNLQIDFGLGKL